MPLLIWSHSNVYLVLWIVVRAEVLDLDHQRTGDQRNGMESIYMVLAPMKSAHNIPSVRWWIFSSINALRLMDWTNSSFMALDFNVVSWGHFPDYYISKLQHPRFFVFTVTGLVNFPKANSGLTHSFLICSTSVIINLFWVVARNYTSQLVLYTYYTLDNTKLAHQCDAFERQGGIPPSKLYLSVTLRGEDLWNGFAANFGKMRRSLFSLRVLSSPGIPKQHPWSRFWAVL